MNEKFTAALNEYAYRVRLLALHPSVETNMAVMDARHVLYRLCDAVQADAKDAARWRHIEMLWMLGDVELTTDEDAQFILFSNPAEHKSEAFTAIDPAATVDAGIAALAARGVK